MKVLIKVLDVMEDEMKKMILDIMAALALTLCGMRMRYNFVVCSTKKFHAGSIYHSCGAHSYIDP